MLDESANVPENIPRGTICLQEIKDQPGKVRTYWFDGEKKISKILEKSAFSPNFFEDLRVSDENSTNPVLCGYSRILM